MFIFLYWSHKYKFRWHPYISQTTDTLEADFWQNVADSVWCRY